MSENSANLQGGQNTEDKQGNKGKINYHSSGIVERDDSVLLTNVREQMDKASEEAKRIKAEARQQAKEKKAASKNDQMKKDVREAKKAVRFVRRRECIAKIKDFFFAGRHKYTTIGVIVVICLLIGFIVMIQIANHHKIANYDYIMSQDELDKEFAQEYDDYKDSGDIGSPLQKYKSIMDGSSKDNLEYRSAAINYARLLTEAGRYREAYEAMIDIEDSVTSDQEKVGLYIQLYETCSKDPELQTQAEAYRDKMVRLSERIDDGEHPYQED